MENPWTPGAVCSPPSTRLPVQLNGRSHYIISPNGTGWSITVRRGRAPRETFHVSTRPEASRLTRRLASDGLVGFVADGEPRERARFQAPRRTARL